MNTGNFRLGKKYLLKEADLHTVLENTANFLLLRQLY